MEVSSLFLFKDAKEKERFFSNNELKPFKFSETEQGKKLRIPVVVRGSYKHSEYGEVDFSQETIDTIVNNFNKQVAGFEPPVFLGHPINTNSMEAHPAIGFIYSLSQEDGILWAETEPVDEQAYEDIKSGKFRYASAEIIRDYKSKFDDSKLGPTLVGLAVTNRPFIPNMPRIQVHSDSSNCTENFSIKQFNLLNDKMITENSMVEPESQDKKTEQINFADQFLSLVKQVEEAKAKADLAESKLKEMEKQDTLAKVDSFNLSQSVKEEFKQLFSAGSFSDDQTKQVLTALQKFSQENDEILLTQHGKQDAKVETLSDRQEVEQIATNPYKEIIEANLKLAEAKRNK